MAAREQYIRTPNGVARHVIAGKVLAVHWRISAGQTPLPQFREQTETNPTSQWTLRRVEGATDGRFRCLRGRRVANRAGVRSESYETFQAITAVHRRECEHRGATMEGRAKPSPKTANEKADNPAKKERPSQGSFLSYFHLRKMRWLSLFFTHCSEWGCLFARRTGFLMKV